MIIAKARKPKPKLCPTRYGDQQPYDKYANSGIKHGQKLNNE